MNFLNRNFFWLLGLVALGFMVYCFSDIVTYVLIAWVLSMLGRPIALFYRKYLNFRHFKLGETGAAALTILTFYALLTCVLLVIVPTIVSQARNLAAIDYQSIEDKIRPLLFSVDLQLHQAGVLSPGESLANTTQQALVNWFKPTLLGDFVGKFLGVAGNIVVTFASVTFILFFFLQDNRLFIGMLDAVVPDTQEAKVKIAVKESSALLTRYFGGLMVQLMVFALLTSIILGILGVKNALLIGVFGGIFNVIPYIGPILGMIFGGFITISSNIDADFALLGPMLLKVMITFIIVQMLDNNFVGPLIMSKSVQAHPLEIFLVTLAAAKVGGVVGMVVGIPVYTVLRVVARTFFSQFKVVQRLTERLDDDETVIVTLIQPEARKLPKDSES